MSIMLASIDCDPGIDFPQRTGSEGRPGSAARKSYRLAVERMFELFDDVDLKGAVTWFVNETDVEWTRDYPELLAEMAARNDTIALHVHHNGLFNPVSLRDRESVLAAARNAIERLEDATGKKIRCHRSGCYFQAEFVYRALAELDFEILSDVFPGYKGKIKSGRELDNSGVPLNARPWRHDETNWMDFRSTKGRFLHVPVCAGGVGNMTGLADKTAESGIEVICWGVHPHEIQNKDGSVNEEAVSVLADAVDRIKSRIVPECLNFNDFARRCSLAGF